MLLPIILTFGAINTLVPLMVIIILIAAGAGLMRGYDIFAVLGISTLAGLGNRMGSKGNLKKSSNPKPLASGLGTRALSGGGGGGSVITNKVKGAAKSTRNAVFAGTGLMGASSVSKSSAQVDKIAQDIAAKAGISSPKPRKDQATGFIKGVAKVGGKAALMAIVPGSTSFNTKIKDRKTLETEGVSGKYKSINPELWPRDDYSANLGITGELKQIEDDAAASLKTTPGDIKQIQSDIRARVEQVLKDYRKIDTDATPGFFAPTKQLFTNVKNLPSEVRETVSSKKKALMEFNYRSIGTFKAAAITGHALVYGGRETISFIKDRGGNRQFYKQQNYDRLETSLGPGRLGYSEKGLQVGSESMQLWNEKIIEQMNGGRTYDEAKVMVIKNIRNNSLKTVGMMWGVAGATIISPPAGFALAYLAFKKKKWTPSSGMNPNVFVPP